MKDVGQPFSLRLDDATMRKAAAFAKRRKVGMTTALRMLISERLDEVEEEAELGAALRWQQQEALSSLERWKKGEGGEVSLAQLRQTRAKVLKRAARR